METMMNVAALMLTENGDQDVKPKYSPLSCRIPSSLCMNGQDIMADFVPHSRAQYMPEGMSLGHVRFAPGEGRSSGQDKQKTALRSRYQAPPPRPSRPPADSPVRTDAGSMQNPGGHWEFGSRAMGGTKKEDQYVKHRAVRVSSLRRRSLHAHASR